MESFRKSFSLILEVKWNITRCLFGVETVFSSKFPEINNISDKTLVSKFDFYLYFYVVVSFIRAIFIYSQYPVIKSRMVFTKENTNISTVYQND